MKKFIFVFFAFFLFGHMAWAATVAVVNDPGGYVAGQYFNQEPKVIALIFGDDVLLISDAAINIPDAKILKENVNREQLYLVRDKRSMSERIGYEVIYARNGVSLAVVRNAEILEAEPLVKLRRVISGMVVIQKPPKTKGEPDPVVQQTIERLEETEYSSVLQALSVNYDTRYACSDEAADVKDWIEEKFTSLGYQTDVQPFNNFCNPCKQQNGFNVIAIKPGKTRPDDFYLAGAHDDSMSGTPCSKAPGSNDNGSGAAGVLELARIFADLETEGTLIFAAFSGEEEGMIGSNAFLQSLIDQGIDDHIKGFVIMDMISFYQSNYGASVEGSAGSAEQLAVLQQIADLAATYTNLEVETTTDYWGSDHQPLLDDGLAGVMYIELDWYSYPYYHTAQDLFEYQDTAYGLDMLKLAAAAMATWGVVLPSADDDSGDDDSGSDDDSGADDDVSDDDTESDNDDVSGDDDISDDDLIDDDSGLPADDDDETGSQESCGC